jgi:hypothetical protein
MPAAAICAGPVSKNNLRTTARARIENWPRKKPRVKVGCIEMNN